MQTEITLNQPPVASATNPAEVLAADAAEAQLADSIKELWRVHSHAQGAARKTREELKLIRNNPSERLHQLKVVLARHSRGGAWSSFLQTQQIPRSTADRMCSSYEKTLAAADGNCPSEQIQEPTEVIIRRYVTAWWPELSKVLPTREAVEMFITELRSAAEKCFDTQEGAGQ